MSQFSTAHLKTGAHSHVPVSQISSSFKGSSNSFLKQKLNNRLRGISNKNNNFCLGDSSLGSAKLARRQPLRRES